MWKNVKWTYPESSGWHSGWRTIFGVCPYGFGLRWDISGHWYRGFAQNFDTFYMGRVVWPGEPFLKKCPNMGKSTLFSKYACPFFQEQVPKMSFSPSVHRQLPWLVLQYFQIHELYQNGWSFSISRYTSYTKMVGFSVFPDSRILKMVGFSIFPSPDHFKMTDDPKLTFI